MNEEVYTPEEVAAMYRVNIQTVWRWLRENELPHKRIGRQYRMTKQNLYDFNAQSKEAYQ